MCFKSKNLVNFKKPIESESGLWLPTNKMEYRLKNISIIDEK